MHVDCIEAVGNTGPMSQVQDATIERLTKRSQASIVQGICPLRRLHELDQGTWL